MSTEAAIYADVLENPDDDVPRLVYADWLDDHGRSGYAEFIRVQCELARLDDGDPRAIELRCRERFLFSRGGKGWIRRDLRRKLYGTTFLPGWSFRRGMIEAVSLSAAQLEDVGKELFRLYPIRHLRLTQLGQLASQATMPDLSRLTDLSFTEGGTPTAAGLMRLMGALNPARLRGLHFNLVDLPPVLSTILLAPLTTGQLERLRLSIFLLPAGLEQLLASPPMHRLQQLELSTGAVANGLAPLCRAPLAGHLRDLTIDATFLGSSAPSAPPARGVMPAILGRVFGRPAAPPPLDLTALCSGLKRLCLHRYRPGQVNEMASFLATPALTGLHTLVFPARQAQTQLSPTVFTLAKFAGLTTLEVPGMRLGTEGFSVLASSPTLSRLASLDVARNELTAESIYWLTQSQYLRQLRCLGLQSNPIGEGLWSLLESDLLPRLCWLDLRHTRLDDRSAAILLARKKELAALTWLDLGHNPLSRRTCDALREAFGPTVRYSRSEGGT